MAALTNPFSFPLLCAAVLAFASLILSLSAPVLALHPLGDTEKAAARELFVLKGDGSFGSPEETYRAVRSLQVLGNANFDTPLTCAYISTSLTSAKDTKDLFYHLKGAETLQCELRKGAITEVLPGLLAALKQATSLLDYHYSVGAISAARKYLSEEKFEDMKATLEEAFDSVKSLQALGQSDGTWYYSQEESESSVKATGVALEAIAGLLSLIGSDRRALEMNFFAITINKVFDNIESYDDGAQYFDEKNVDKISGSGGSLAATSTVLRGVAALVSLIGSEEIEVGADKFNGIATFFLSMGILENPTEAYFQLDALGTLDDNSLFIPLVLSLPSFVLSRTTNDKLQVAVTTVLGTATPVFDVTLKSAVPFNSKSTLVWSNQKLHAVEGGKLYSFDFLSEETDTGRYDLNFEISSPDRISRYSAGGPHQATITVTGKITISDVEVAVVDSDTGNADFMTKLDSSNLVSTSVSANHLQKLKLSFKMVSPSRIPFHPQQVFMKLKHESGVEHLYLVKPSGAHLKLTLDFLGLVEKLYYLSGEYKMQLIIGDTRMENPVNWDLGSLELDLPEAPEGAVKPPEVGGDVQLNYGPKPEISHIFRVPEKRPATQVSAGFLVITLLPLLGFLLGLRFLGANLKGFPLSGLPLLPALGFHAGILSVLLLYLLFWLKLNLFTTLQLLGFLGLFTAVTGHFLLSYMADVSSKVKTA